MIVAGDMDADDLSDSMRFWAGRHVIGGLSVCYRSAWESVHPGQRGETFTPENPYSVNPDWPFRSIDHVLIRCGDPRWPVAGDPQLPADIRPRARHRQRRLRARGRP